MNERPDHDTTDCPKCGGSGRLIHEDHATQMPKRLLCWKCRGWGWITLPTLRLF